MVVGEVSQRAGTHLLQPCAAIRRRRRRLCQLLAVLSLPALSHSPLSFRPRYSSWSSIVAVVGCWVLRRVCSGTTRLIGAQDEL